MSRLLNMRQAAEYLGLSKSWVQQRAQSGEIPCVRLGRLVRFDPPDLDRYIEQCKGDRCSTSAMRSGGASSGSTEKSNATARERAIERKLRSKLPDCDSPLALLVVKGAD